MNTNDFSRSVIKNKITSGFWKEKTELITNVVLPYQWDALNDRIKNAPKSYCMRNFRLAGETMKKRMAGEQTPVFPVDKWEYTDKNSDESSFHGWVFQDSDFYKWIEAVGYSLIQKENPALEKTADEAIDIVVSAQMDNGYLDTLYIINNPELIFTNLKDNHELYCFGHMCEGAISYFNATGKDKLLNAACRFADLLCDTFGENKKRGYPGHEIAEMALVELYETTGEKRYLDMAKFFIDERGKKPLWFDVERNCKTDGKGYEYNQSHIEVRRQNEAVGHAVRAVYLYSGMADVARFTNDDELYNACKNLFESITMRKMYITGGIGSTADGEAFSYDYYLPNDSAYAESCASIGLVFFAQRMLKTEPDSVYADVIERALYNGILSGISLDGKSFFYVNPLEVNPDVCEINSNLRHVKPERQKWFGCACCPPNIARLITSVGRYCVTQNDKALFVHQYISGNFSTENAKIKIVSGFPYNGCVKISITPQKPIIFAFRIPWWAKEYSFSAQPVRIEKGYAYFKIGSAMELTADFKMNIALVKTDRRVHNNLGKVAVMRGPLVFCIEQADNGADLQLLKLTDNSQFEYDDEKIISNGIRETDTVTGLYNEYSPSDRKITDIHFIPYFKWANRGKGEMTVFVRTDF